MPKSRAGRVALWSAIFILLLVVVAIVSTLGVRPFIGPRKRAVTAQKFSVTPERRARGEYLVKHVSLCFGCHTAFDVKGRTEPVLTVPPGSGNNMGGDASVTIVAPNITPDPKYGIGNWSDDEVARAIREGVAKDGHALFPVMPYRVFSSMSDEDVESIVVFLRAQPAVERDPGKTKLPWVLARIMNMVPQPVTEPVATPDKSNAVAYGKYLANGAGICVECHTPRDPQGKPMDKYQFAGGNIFADSGKSVATANITPDPTGIAGYTEASFVDVLRTGKVNGRQLDPMMPWWGFRGMTDADLKAVYAYLRTVKPVNHKIDNTVAPTWCKIDGQKHGLGDQNQPPQP